MDPALEYLSKKCLETASQVTKEQREKLADLISTNHKVFIYGSGRSGLVLASQTTQAARGHKIECSVTRIDILLACKRSHFVRFC